MATTLANKTDMQEFTAFSINTPDELFNPRLQQITDRIGGYISDELLTAILALTRGNETPPETYAFWFDYVRPYVVQSIYVSMMQTHGFNVTGQGLTVFSDGQNTSAPLQERPRSQMIRDAKSNEGLYLNKMLFEFKQKSGIFDGTSYEVNPEKYDVGARQTPAMNVLGGVNKRLPYNNKFRL